MLVLSVVTSVLDSATPELSLFTTVSDGALVVYSVDDTLLCDLFAPPDIAIIEIIITITTGTIIIIEYIILRLASLEVSGNILPVISTSLSIMLRFLPSLS